MATSAGFTYACVSSSAVVIPEGTARREFQLASPELVQIETDIGATTLIAGQVRDALRPDNPRTLRVAVGVLGRLEFRAGAPACGWRPENGGCRTGWVEDLAVAGEGLGRSRGGLTSKIHLAVDGHGRPCRSS